MNANYLDILKSNNLFKDFSKEELLDIFQGSNYKIETYNKGRIVHLHNEKCYTVDLILKGELMVQRIDEEGRILTITTFGPGDVLGGNLVFANNNVYPMTIISKNQCTIMHIKSELILQLCQKNQNFLLQFLRSISDKTLILSTKLTSITMKSIRQCIIEFLRYEYYYENSNVIKLKLSKKEWAERLGIQRPSLSRELRKMKSDGLIDFDSKTITIKNLDVIN